MLSGRPAAAASINRVNYYMAVSKRIRFEVFKRDGFACQYCGQKTPAAVLQCDHIDPSSRGGSDEVDNLITSCVDCNQGKSNVPLSSIPACLADRKSEIEERESQVLAYREFLREVKARQQADVDLVNDCFERLFPGQTLSDRFQQSTIPLFLEHFVPEEPCEFLLLAFQRVASGDPDDVVHYFCGICWRKIKEGGRR